MSSDDSSFRTLVETMAPLALHDATLARMLKTKRPLTMATYLRMEYPEGVPPLTAEVLASVPAPLLGAVDPETEEDGFRAEALRRERVRRMTDRAANRSGTKTDGGP